MTAKQAVFNVLDEMPDGCEFKGIQLARAAVNRCGQMMYPSSALRHLRSYRLIDGKANIVNIGKPKSWYKKVVI